MFGIFHDSILPTENAIRGRKMELVLFYGVACIIKRKIKVICKFWRIYFSHDYLTRSYLLFDFKLPFIHKFRLRHFASIFRNLESINLPTKYNLSTETIGIPMFSSPYTAKSPGSTIYGC
jgi:hypothetical protein